MGFDGIWMDLEHHGYSLETAQQLMRSPCGKCRHRGSSGQRRIHADGANARGWRTGHHVSALRQRKKRPRSCVGQSSPPWAVAASTAVARTPGTVACRWPNTSARNEETFVVIQLEEQHALECADEIARVEGVDVLMLGPADLSITGGFAGQFDHPNLTKAAQRQSPKPRKKPASIGDSRSFPRRMPMSSCSEAQGSSCMVSTSSWSRMACQQFSKISRRWGSLSKTR